MSSGTSSDTSAVSPVVAVILLVAVTVALSAVIGGFALNLGQQTTGSQQSSIGVKSSGSGGNVTVTIVTGEADEVRLIVNGSVADSVSDASAGDTLSAQNASGADVTVVTVTDGEKSIVSTVNPIDGSESSISSGIAGPTDGLIAYYPLDNGTGGTAYESISSNDGTITGALWTNVSKTGGYALNFDGTGDTVEAAHKDELNLTTFTVSVWVKFDDVTRSTWQVVAMKGSGAGTNAERNYAIYESDSSEKIHYSFYRSNGTFASYDSASNVTAGKWYHVVTTYDGSTYQLYLNGTSDKAASESGTPAMNNEPFYIGETPDYSGVNGTVDDVRIYNRSLNSTEVSDLYNATK